MVSMGLEKELMALKTKVTTVKMRPNKMKKMVDTSDPKRSIEPRGSVSGPGKNELDVWSQQGLGFEVIERLSGAKKNTRNQNGIKHMALEKAHGKSL